MLSISKAKQDFFFKIGSHENAFTFKRIKQIAWTAPKMLLQKNIVQQLLDKLRLQNFKKVKSYFLTSNFEQKSSEYSLCVISNMNTIRVYFSTTENLCVLQCHFQCWANSSTYITVWQQPQDMCTAITHWK